MGCLPGGFPWGIGNRREESREAAIRAENTNSQQVGVVLCSGSATVAPAATTLYYKWDRCGKPGRQAAVSGAMLYSMTDMEHEVQMLKNRLWDVQLEEPIADMEASLEEYTSTPTPRLL